MGKQTRTTCEKKGKGQWSKTFFGEHPDPRKNRAHKGSALRMEMKRDALEVRRSSEKSAPNCGSN